MSGKRTKQEMHDYYVQRMSDPAKKQRVREQAEARRRRVLAEQAQGRIGAMGELLAWCQMRAIECKGATEERGWLWICRWVRTQIEREQEKLERVVVGDG
jgi:hypothetical protein